MTYEAPTLLEVAVSTYWTRGHGDTRVPRGDTYWTRHVACPL